MTQNETHTRKRPSPMRRGVQIAFRTVFTVMLFSCITFIFANSLEVGLMSSSRSVQVTEWLNRLLERLHTGIQLDNALVRKLAHFAEYCALGFLLMICTRVYTNRILGHISWPLFLSLLIAVVDECLQLLTDGRAGQLTDVVLDFSGSLLGVVLGLFVLLLGKQFWSELSMNRT